MAEVTGNCPECEGRIIKLDPFVDQVLYEIFGEQDVSEHNLGCSQYPQTREVSLDGL